MQRFRSLLLVLALCLAAAAAHAQTMYVDDELVITLRTGPSTRNAIIRNLRSGDAVEILEQNEAGDYARVRLAGTEVEGWVRTQYLSAEPIAADRLAAAERERSAATARAAELETQLRSLRGERDQLGEQLAASDDERGALAAELEDIRNASANAIALRDENVDLRAQAERLNERIASLNNDNAELRSRSRHNWFLIGAAVLFVGLIMGLIAPSLRPRRKSGW